MCVAWWLVWEVQIYAAVAIILNYVFVCTATPCEVLVWHRRWSKRGRGNEHASNSTTPPAALAAHNTSGLEESAAGDKDGSLHDFGGDGRVFRSPLAVDCPAPPAADTVATDALDGSALGAGTDDAADSPQPAPPSPVNPATPASAGGSSVASGAAVNVDVSVAGGDDTVDPAPATALPTGDDDNDASAHVASDLASQGDQPAVDDTHSVPEHNECKDASASGAAASVSAGGDDSSGSNDAEAGGEHVPACAPAFPTAPVSVPPTQPSAGTSVSPTDGGVAAPASVGRGHLRRSEVFFRDWCVRATALVADAASRTCAWRAVCCRYSPALLTKWKGVKVVSWLVIVVALAYYVASIAWASNLQTPEGTVVCRCLL